jgi:hypothetical protein
MAKVTKLTKKRKTTREPKASLSQKKLETIRTETSNEEGLISTIGRPIRIGL